MPPFFLIKKFMYLVKKKFQGCKINDMNGVYLLTENVTQETLEYLYKKGHLDKIEKTNEPKQTKPKSDSENISSINKQRKTAADKGKQGYKDTADEVDSFL